MVYVGRWGDIKRDGWKTLWTDITNKSDEDLVNLAIVRIKEEQDYLDNVIIKYIEVLNELELIDERLYKRIKYGTDNDAVIICIRNGLSLGLAVLLVEKYSRFLEIDFGHDNLWFQDGLEMAMKNAAENEIMINELRNFI